ncbi:hypothetical protein [Trichormus azollae]|uniref:hypothetical protein n=1 Tax=Trichormus azollae TaxID=1164 RepID=UPI00325EEC55
MTPLFEHENPKIQLSRLIFTLAKELKTQIRSAGSRTLKRQRVTKGIEPKGIEQKSSFYIKNEPQIRG